MKNIILYLSIIILPISGYSCSAFKYVDDGQVFVGKNFDWHLGEGFVIKNNRNQTKCTYLKYESKNTCWTSKYGSITFNQNGKEFPYGGMNEKGLVVEMLWLKETIYKESEENINTISELEWIQYQLDNFETVSEVIENLEKIEIDPITSTIHYFITDKNGHSVIVEYLDGELIIAKSSDDIQTITNSANVVNTKFYIENSAKLGQIYNPKSKHTTLRYCSIQNNLEKFPETEGFSVDAAFRILDKVSESRGSYKTQWSIVYDVANANITFKTFENKNSRNVSLADLDFGSSINTYYRISDSSTLKSITNLMKIYTSEANFTLIEQGVKPKLKFDFAQLNKHQINPNQSNLDKVFSDNHMDVTITIITKKNKGNVRYFLANSELDYKRQGPYGGDVKIKSNKTYHKLYSLPTNAKYAYGAMHDVNGNGYLDRNIFKIPKEPFSFSGKKRYFFLPPKFKNAVFELSDEVIIVIK